MERVAEAIARAYANSPFLAGLVDRNADLMPLIHAGDFDTALAKQPAQLFADVNELVQVIAELACIGVGNHRHGQGATCRWVDRLPALLQHFIYLHNDFSYL